MARPLLTGLQPMRPSRTKQNRPDVLCDRRGSFDLQDDRESWVVHAVLAVALAAIVVPLVLAMHLGSGRPAVAPATATSGEPTLALFLIHDAGVRR
jgi:hypothetical protein